MKEQIRRMALDAGFSRARFLASFLPDARSLLTLALPYGNQMDQAETIPDEGLARIAPFARRNYYREAVKRLQRLSVDIRTNLASEYRKSDFRILCNSRVPEKPLARASGLGVIGRNSLIITPEAGSLVIIAAMTLPFVIPADPPLSSKPFPLCDGCGDPPCVRACPTAALNIDGTIDRRRCIQWYASGNGEAVPPDVAQLWGNRLYGCTECQDVCIHNQRPIPPCECAEGALPAYMDPVELLALGDEELRSRFRGTCLGLSWLGPAAIRRNARLVLGARGC
jgi:epoxyqueuosine reductase